MKRYTLDIVVDSVLIVCYHKSVFYVDGNINLQYKRLSKSEFYSDVKEHMLTEANKQKAKKGLKIAGIVFGIILLVDLISFIIYAAVFGLSQ